MWSLVGSSSSVNIMSPFLNDRQSAPLHVKQLCTSSTVIFSKSGLTMRRSAINLSVFDDALAAISLAYYIMPIPPPAGIAGAAGKSSLISEIPASVVRSIPATLEAF